MQQVQVGYAKTHLSALLARVEQGEALAIARRGKVIAKLVPSHADLRPATLAFKRAWALGGADLPDSLEEGALLPADDIQLD